MLQLHPELNLLGACPLQPRLNVLKCLSPVNRLRVMVPVKKLWRLPDADAGGGPLGTFMYAGKINYEFKQKLNSDIEWNKFILVAAGTML